MVRVRIESGSDVRLGVRGLDVKMGTEAMAVADFTRITVDPAVLDGIPCIRGLRIPVATVVGMVADGMTRSDILATYPDLESEDIRVALAFAAAILSGSSLVEVPPVFRIFPGSTRRASWRMRIFRLFTSRRLHVGR